MSPKKKTHEKQHQWKHSDYTKRTPKKLQTYNNETKPKQSTQQKTITTPKSPVHNTTPKKNHNKVVIFRGLVGVWVVCVLVGVRL